jgi:tetratricopeptide (TPR) repeat protein
MSCSLSVLRRITALPLPFALSAAFVCAVAWNSAALADEIADVNLLYQSRKYAEALGKADAYLKRSPRDAAMRFVKGLTLADMGRHSEAIEVFKSLIADFPSMPEPYNNLAVLYAASGQYDQARAVLERAVEANPNYTRASENLADTYVTLASQYYARTLQQDPGNAKVRLKYLKVRSALETGEENAPSAKGNAPANAAVSAPMPAKLAADTKVAQPAVARPATQAVAVPDAAAAEERAVLDAVKSWAQAWSSQDIVRYFASYAPKFRPPGGASRAEWEAQRRSRIVKDESIKVQIDSPVVSVKDGTATVRFLQHYVSGAIDSNDRKILIMERSDGRWQIVQERSGG